ncbi:MAG: hypothetical protein ACREMQ_18060, partial [Longimicrobiales bacterium]
MRNASILAFIVLSVVVGACDALSSEPGEVLSITQLKYRLLDRYELFYCDPDYWPIVRGDEQERSLQRFPDIAADAEKFGAILEHLGFTGRTDFSAQEKLLIYREDKRLVFVALEAVGPDYRFDLRASEQQQVLAITGEIDSFGDIAERQRVLAVGTCPICLSGETLIATAEGPVRVRDLTGGTMVWSQDDEGRRILVRNLVKSSTPMPIGHEFIRLRL